LQRPASIASQTRPPALPLPRPHRAARPSQSACIDRPTTTSYLPHRRAPDPQSPCLPATDSGPIRSARPLNPRESDHAADDQNHFHPVAVPNFVPPAHLACFVESADQIAFAPSPTNPDVSDTLPRRNPAPRAVPTSSSVAPSSTNAAPSPRNNR